MRNLILMFSLALVPILGLAQDGEGKLKFHSVSVSPGFYAAIVHPEL